MHCAQVWLTGIGYCDIPVELDEQVTVVAQFAIAVHCGQVLPTGLPLRKYPGMHCVQLRVPGLQWSQFSTGQSKQVLPMGVPLRKYPGLHCTQLWSVLLSGRAAPVEQLSLPAAQFAIALQRIQ